MPVTCPQCSYENPDHSGFCVSCGNRLQPTTPTGQISSPSSGLYLPTYISPPVASTPPPPPAGPSYQPPNLSSALPSSSIYAPPPSYPTQMGTGQGLASIRRAFAGHGTLVMHYSWLLEGKHQQAAAVSTTILQMLRQRNIAGLNANSEKLVERGLLMEERSYLTVYRGASSVFIYAAPAGQDLYISRATTVLPVISYARAVILGLLFLLMIFGLAEQQALQSSYSPFGVPVYTGGLAATCLALLFYPLLLCFIILLVRSFLNWLVEKDFWVYLRPNTLNDFQLDDIALLEHVADDVVRGAVEQLGLDASKITSPVQGYQPKRKIRTI